MHQSIGFGRSLAGPFLTTPKTSWDQSEFITTAKLLHDYYLHMKKIWTRFVWVWNIVVSAKANIVRLAESKEIVQAAFGRPSVARGTGRSPL